MRGLVEEERKKLLREAAELKDFLPRGVLRDQADVDFISNVSASVAACWGSMGACSYGRWYAWEGWARAVCTWLWLWACQRITDPPTADPMAPRPALTVDAPTVPWDTGAGGDGAEPRQGHARAMSTCGTLRSLRRGVLGGGSGRWNALELVSWLDAYAHAMHKAQWGCVYALFNMTV